MHRGRSSVPSSPPPAFCQLFGHQKGKREREREKRSRSGAAAAPQSSCARGRGRGAGPGPGRCRRLPAALRGRRTPRPAPRSYFGWARAALRGARRERTAFHCSLWGCCCFLLFFFFTFFFLFPPIPSSLSPSLLTIATTARPTKMPPVRTMGRPLPAALLSSSSRTKETSQPLRLGPGPRGTGGRGGSCAARKLRGRIAASHRPRRAAVPGLSAQSRGRSDQNVSPTLMEFVFFFFSPFSFVFLLLLPLPPKASHSPLSTWPRFFWYTAQSGPAAVGAAAAVAAPRSREERTVPSDGIRGRG